MIDKTKILVRSLLLTVMLLPMGGLVQAQSSVDTVSSIPGIQIKTAVDKAQIFVGDRITYTITITYDSTYELIPPPLGANLGAFEVKDYDPDKTTRLKNGKMQSETKFILSTFTTGEYVIPPLPVVFRMPDSSSRALLAEGVPISVKSLLGEENGKDSVDIKPLKEPLRAEYIFKDAFKSPYYRVVGGILLLLGALAVWYFARRRKAAAEFVDPRTPWEIALEDLALLEQKQLWEGKEYRLYYFELTEIVRAFLGRIYDVDVLEMTTTELIAQFADKEMPGQSYPDLMEFLKHADLVKFAKYTPETTRGGQDYTLAHGMIVEIRDEHLRRQQAEMRLKKTGSGVSTESAEAVEDGETVV